jgi:hypothetical protein
MALRLSAAYPIAVLYPAVVLKKSVFDPIAVLLSPVVLL